MEPAELKDKRPRGCRPVSKDHPITCPYGRPGKQWKRGFHQGVDFGCPKKTETRAWRDGVVEWAGDAGDGFGRYIRVRHDDGTKSYYCHMDSIFIVAGDHVKKGQVLGLSGNTGNIWTWDEKLARSRPITEQEREEGRGAHVHFETRLDGEPFEPAFEEEIA